MKFMILGIGLGLKPTTFVGVFLTILITTFAYGQEIIDEANYGTPVQFQSQSQSRSTPAPISVSKPTTVISSSQKTDGGTLSKPVPPSDEQIMAVVNHAIEKGNQAVRRAGGMPTPVQCPDNMMALGLRSDEKLKEDPVTQSHICFASKKDLEWYQKALETFKSIPDDKLPQGDKTLSTVTYQIRHENDINVPMYLLRGDLSDDVGRTMGLEDKVSVDSPKYTVDMSMKYEGFSKRTRVNGKSMSPEGKYYLQFYDVTRLQTSLGIKVDEHTKRIFEAEIESRTGNGKGLVAQKVQQGWHKLVHEGELEYDYQDHDPPGKPASALLTMMTGLQKKVETNWAGFHCMAIGTGLVGVDSQGRGVVKARLEGQISTGDRWGRTQDNPVLAMKAWAETLNRTVSSESDRFDRSRQEVGVEIAGSVRVSKCTFVEPFAQVIYYNSPADRFYSMGSRDGQTGMYSGGARIRYVLNCKDL